LAAPEFAAGSRGALLGPSVDSGLADVCRHIAIWQILALTVFLGIVAAFEMPTRQAFTLDMIERVEDLPNAIALNSSLFNASRLVGPSLAGVMIASIGEAGCFLINGLSYLAILLALWAMRLPRPVVTKAKKPLLHDLLAGFRYGWNFTPIRNILLLLALLSLMGMPYAVLMPVFAKDILRGGPHTLGILMAASGFGALIGTIYLAGRKSVLGLGAQLPLMAGCFGVGLIGFAFSKNLVLSAACLALSGFGMMTSMASSNTILQSIAEEDKRGRLMSLYTLALAGVAPFGSLMAGTFAKYLGAPRTVAAGGAACMIAAGLFALQIESLRRQIHPIYTQKGILPEVAKGLGAASTVTTYTQEN
jgi:MFS family permease